MKLTDALLGEHALFYPMFDAATELCGRAKEPADVALIAQLLAAAITTHAGLEDSLLFPALEARGAAAGPVRVMRAEHHEIEAMLRTVAQASDVDSARDRLLRLLDFLIEHFRKEERMLFPMSEAALGDEELEALGERWRRERGF